MSFPPDAIEIIRQQIPPDSWIETPRPVAWRKLVIALGITAVALFGCVELVRAENAPQPPRMVCGTQAEALAALKDRYGERPAAMGVTVDGMIAQLMLDPKDGSWTLLITAPPDRTCVLIGGDGWEPVPQGDAT